MMQLTDVRNMLRPALHDVIGRLGYVGPVHLEVDYLYDDLKLNGQTLYTRKEIDDNLYKRDFQDRVTAILMPRWSETGNVTDIASLIWANRDGMEA